MALHIEISIADQMLILWDGQTAVARYAVCTARKGVGEQRGSECTPRGAHIIRAKIGAGAPLGAVFRGRRATGEIHSDELDAAFPGRDWILTRILWLSGCEPGFNRLGQVDTMRRYIYIHGTPDRVPLGLPSSHGCINMRNTDVVELFDRVPCYTPVRIHE